jgi:GAF domain-containing protein
MSWKWHSERRRIRVQRHYGGEEAARAYDEQEAAEAAAQQVAAALERAVLVKPFSQ